MQKMMFNDKYGLTEAVLNGRVILMSLFMNLN
jgi:hypothetical protein